MYEFLKYYEIPVILVAKANGIPREENGTNMNPSSEKLDFDPADTFTVAWLYDQEDQRNQRDAILENAFYE